MNSSQHRPNNRILIIDDNPSIHDDIRKILTSAEAANPILTEVKAAVLGPSSPAAPGTSFNIDSALQGDEALELVRHAIESGNPYALAFLDMRMPPGWDGITTLGHLWKADPDLQVVICTAYSDYQWEEIARKIGKTSNMVILKKPFDNIEVLQLAHALAEKWRLNEQVRDQLTNLDNLVRQRTSELETANEQLRHEIAERALVEEALRQAQKMEAVGQLAAGVAHDFNNILTIILGHVSLLSEIEVTSETRDSVQEIRESAERATSLVRQLLAFSRKQMILPTPLDLSEVITNLGAVLNRVLGEQVMLQVQPQPDLPLIEADLRMIEQVVINLAVNARDSMPHGGSLTISANEVEISPEVLHHNPEARPGRCVCLSIEDTGCGIPPEILPRIFEPFFTTKDAGKGTGLGLASAYGIVKQHAGWIEVQSKVGYGTTFRLFFPVCFSKRRIHTDHQSETRPSGGDETILVVEDEPAVKRLAVDVLKRNGYRVFEAESGAAALKTFNEHGSEIDLLLTDMVMPGGIPGQELARQLRTQRPSLKVVYMTGYSQNIAGTTTDPSAALSLLTKPFSCPDLLRMIRRCLEASE